MDLMVLLAQEGFPEIHAYLRRRLCLSFQTNIGMNPIKDRHEFLGTK